MKNQYQEAILETIDILVQEYHKQLKFNYYIEASVMTVNSDGTYNIEFNNQQLNKIKARDGLELIVGDVVLVCVVNGNFSNKFIDLKRP